MLWEQLMGDGSSKTDMVIMFHSLNDLNIAPFTKVSEPADPNRNFSSSKWAVEEIVQKIYKGAYFHNGECTQ